MTQSFAAPSGADRQHEIHKLAECDESLSCIASDVRELSSDLTRLRTEGRDLARLASEQDELLEKQRATIATLQEEREHWRKQVEAATSEIHANEHRLAQRDERIAALERDAVVAGRDTSVAEGPEPGHVRLLALPDGYRLAVSDEPCARPGDHVEVDGRSFIVARIGPSPLPRDGRRCAFLVPRPS